MSDMHVVTLQPRNAEPSWEDLGEALTPRFFQRNHYPWPQHSIRSLEVCGRAFSLEELQALPSLTHEVVLECAGNGRSFMAPQPPGTPWGWRGVSNALWTGVSLAQLLRLAPPSESCSELIFQGGEHQDYARSMPLDECYRPEILVAYAMNGQPLPLEYGGPLRLLVPGSYAMASVKWLTQIRATSVPFAGYYQVEDYQFRPGPPSEGSRPVLKMLPRALVVQPQSGQRLSGEVEVRGWAWSGFAPIVAVEVLLDQQPLAVELGPLRGPYAWRAFSCRLTLPVGKYCLSARAQDALGHCQPQVAPWNEQGYENNSMMQVDFQVF